MKRLLLPALLALLAPLARAADAPPPVLKIPGQADRPIAPESLLGRQQYDVRIEDVVGNVTVYHGMPLLNVLDKNGFDTRTMAGERRSAAAIVVATGRDGYTAVFSVGELRMHRRDPKIFLVSETAAGPLPEKEGPVRLIVYGDVVRSAYGLTRVELRFVAENKPAAGN